MGIIHFEEIGEGRPAVLIHGFAADRRLMTGCMEPIFLSRQGGAGRRRFYIDLPGMGETPAPEYIADSDGIVDEVLAFIDEKLPSGPFLLIGESYGAYLAREILRRSFARVEGLLLICPAVLPHREDRELPAPRVLKKIDFPRQGARHPKESADYNDFTVQTPRTWERYLREVIPGARAADRAFLKKLRPRGYALKHDPDILPEPFDKPALILLGRQDHLVGYRDGWKIVDNFPRGTFAILDRAGHNLQIEQPGLFNTLVSEWLDRVEESRPRNDPETG
jgi:pimeloyl-ACP methyl ester carboxylesterase